MAFLSAAEKGRIWSSLDDNLREQIRSGELTFEEAQKFVVPIGDLQLQQDRERYPIRTGQTGEELQVTPPSGEEYGFGTMLDINLTRGGQSIDAFGAEGDVAALEANRRAEAAAGQSVGQTLTQRLASRARAGADTLRDPTSLVNPLGLVAEGVTGAFASTVETMQDELASRTSTTDERSAIEKQALANLTRNLEQINEATNYMKTLPQNPYSTGFIEAVDNGDFLTAAKLAIPAGGSVMGEQALELAASAAVAGTVYYTTRNPKATAAAAKIAAGAGASMEYGSDLADLWEQVPESERTYEKFKEVQGIARQAAGARMLIESALPGYGAQLGNTLTKKAVYELALQMSAGALGEEIATRSKTGTGDTFVGRLATGEGASAGELALEAIADSAGVITEAYPSLKRAAEQDRVDLAAERYVEQERNRAFAQQLSDLEMQNRAEANRATFDAEAEADRLIEGIKMQSAEQMEMPFGSGYAGSVEGGFTDEETGVTGINPARRIGLVVDRVPGIADMFGGETVSAAQAELDRNRNVEEAQALAEGRPNLTQEEFEARKRNEFKARRQIDNRQQVAFEDQKLQEFVERSRAEEAQQADFERTKEQENTKRRQEAEDKTTLRNERGLLATADITREAKTLLATELEGVRRQRQGIARTPGQMDSILKAYERKRLPELINNVRDRRLARVNEAREREIARDNAKLEAESEKKAAADAQKKFTTAPRTKANQERGIPRWPATEGTRGNLTDLLPGNQLKAGQTFAAKGDVAEREAQDAFETDAQQRLLDLPPRGAQGTMDLPQGQDEQGSLFTGDGRAFRGTLTDKQKRLELDARVKQRREDGGRKAKADEERAVAELSEREAAVAAEIPTVAKAIAQEQTKQANLTSKKYAKQEQDALKDIVKEELSNADNRSADEIQSAVATKLAAWRKANPRPDSVPAPSASLVEQARTVAKRQEGAKKAAETKATNKALAREIARGATPEEAAEIVANQRLSKEEESDLRNELGGKSVTKAEPKEQINTNGVIDWTESVELRNMYEDILSSRSLTRLGDLLNRMATSEDVSPEGQWLAARMAPLATRLGIDLDESERKGTDRAYGWFSPEANVVGVNRTDEETILHEALHAVTSRMLLSKITARDPTVQRARAELEAVIAAAKAHYKVIPQSVTPSLREYLDHSTGPLSNVRELISFGLTNREFVTWLSGIPMPGQKKSLWQGFKDAIAKFLRPQTAAQRNALDAVIEATNNLIGLQEQTPAINALAGQNLNSAGRVEALPARASAVPAAPFSNPRTRQDFINLGPISIRPEWKNKKTIGGAIIDAFTSGAGGLKVSTEIFDRAQSDTAALIFRAEKLYGIIDSSLEARAPQTKEGIEQYRQKFIEDITAFENETGRLQKAKLAKGIRTEYGAAGRAYFSMRRTIDSLSKDILRQRLEDPRPFTNAEAKIYRSIRDNIGKYYTRVYAANTKGLGERRAKELKKAYNAVVEGSTEEQFIQGYETVRNAATFIRENVLAIPDEATLQDMPLIRLQRLANAWGIEPTTGADMDNPLVGEAYREALIEGLSEFADQSPEARDAKALELVLEALNRNDSTIMNYYRGSKQDRTIVTERESVPEEIRKLLGEYEDIPLRAMITIARQAEFRARNRAFNELIAAEQGSRVLTPKEFTAGGFDPEEWVLMKGPAYGALEGMRVRKDLAIRIEDSAEVSRTFDQVWAMAESRPLEIMKKALGEAVTGWAKFASAVKAVQLVWNVGNAAFNFLGGPFILMANGNLNPKHSKRALGIAWDLINSARQSTPPTADSQKVIRAGITDSAFMGEIRAVELEQLRQLTLEGFASETGRKAGKFKQAVRGGKRMWREAYAMADVTWKISNFLAEEEKLQKFYKAEGINKTSEQIEREAAWRTNLSNFSYKRVPNILKVVEKGGLTYVMPYIYETVRANVGSVFVGIHDLKMASAATTSEGARQMQLSGFKRITGSLMALGLAQYMATQAIKMVAEGLGQTDDEQEEWIEDLKAMLPDYKRFSDYVYMGRSEDGKPVLFELSRLDPFGPVTEFFRMGVQGATPEQMLEGLKGMWINNPYGSSILSAFFGSPGTSTRMERIQPGFAGGLTNTLAAALDFVPFVDIADADAAARRTVKAVDAVFPSMPLNIFDPNNKNAEGDVVGWVMTNMMGVKVHNVDPAVSTQYAGLDFKAQQTDVRNAFVNFLKTSTDLSDNEILNRYTALQEQEQENFEKIEKQYNGLLRLGYTDMQAIQMLKVAGLSENDLAIVYSGGYKPQYSGIVNFANLERSYMDTVQMPNVPAAKKQEYLENLSTLVGLVEQGQIPARSE